MRFVFLIASLVCALVAATIAINLVDLGENHSIENRIAVGWAAGSFALYVAAALVGGER